MAVDISGQAIIAAGAIVGATLAGTFSYLNLITSKEQKVSEFRQQWIDALRASISEYLSALAYLSILYKHFVEKQDGQKDRFEMVKTVQETYARVNRSYNDIIFRINPSDNDSEGNALNIVFLSALRETRARYNDNDFMGAVKACDAVRDAGSPLLKYEWKRVKTGEPSYNVAKRVAFTALVIGLVAALILPSYAFYSARSAIGDTPGAASGAPKAP